VIPPFTHLKAPLPRGCRLFPCPLIAIARSTLLPAPPPRFPDLYPAFGLYSMPANNHYARRDHGLHDKPNGANPGAGARSRSPTTPAVTGIDYPSMIDDTSTDLESTSRVYHNGFGSGGNQRFYTLPNIAASSIEGRDDQIANNSTSLDQVWGAIRQQKERRMAKEKPKVQSLEEITQELLLADQPQPMHVPVESHSASLPKSLKKPKSM